MNSEITVSVCMITFNHETFISQAILSVLEQECDFEFELIVANDCSSDETHEQIQKLLKNHPQRKRVIYYNHKKNIGVIANFKDALTKCTGKYIALCDGDDYWTDVNKLQTQVDFLDSNRDYIACFHNAKVVNQKEQETNFHEWSSAKEVDVEDIIMRGGGIFPTAALLYRNVINPDQFSLNTKSGDSIIAYNLASLGKVYFINKYMSVYRLHDGGVYTSLRVDSHKVLEDLIGNIGLLTKFRKESARKYKKHYNNAIRKQLQRISNRVGLKFILNLVVKNKLQIIDCLYYLKHKIIK